MFRKSDTALIQVLIVYCKNIKGALFYLLKKVVNLIATFFLRISNAYFFYIYYSLSKKCPYSELFWSVFSRIWTEYGEIPYLFIFSPNAEKHGQE